MDIPDAPERLSTRRLPHHVDPHRGTRSTFPTDSPITGADYMATSRSSGTARRLFLGQGRFRILAPLVINEFARDCIPTTIILG
jgi:hypothetical protein